MSNNSRKFNENKDEVIRLRKEGYGYKRIARQLGSSESTIKRWCKKLGLDGYLGTKPIEAKTNGKQCLQCSEPVVTVNPYAKFCSKKCKDRHYQIKHRRKKIVSKQCKVCGGCFETNLPNKIYCSEECVHKNYQENILAKPYEKTCKSCFEIFEGRQHKLYCSERCGYEYNYKLIKQARPVYNKRCTECGKHYSTTGELSKYCSTECSIKYNRRKTEIKRRQQLKYNGRIDWDISIERLIRRDGDECYLCNERCDLNDFETREDGTFIAGEGYPSIEHVIPVAKGGTHTWSNVKLAHRRCNTLKRDKIINIREKA